MDITPDTKDWTWVLDRPCPECGFDSRSITHEEVPGLIRDNASQWVQPLSESTARDRPAPDVWSPVEYACHVRDVHVLFDDRLVLMLADDDPQFANWNQDDTAIEQRYHEQEAAQVESELQAAADRIASRFDAVSGAQWQRSGRRTDGAEFTVATFARYHLHDIIHHIYDVTGARSPGQR